MKAELMNAEPASAIALSYRVRSLEADTYEQALAAWPDIVLARLPLADSAGWLSQADPDCPVDCRLTLPSLSVAQQIKALIEVVAELKGWPAPAIHIERIPARDWVAHTANSLPALQIGRFWLYGRQWRHLPRAPQLWALEIDAGLAFGTGHHETTRGCLLLMQMMAKRHRLRRLLDLGCGSGVLAMAAAKSQRRLHYLGFDLDRDSVQVARSNARRNGVAAQGRFVLASQLERRPMRDGKPYDCLFANILAEPLVALSPGIARRTAPGGQLVLAGLLREQSLRVERAYLARGFRLKKRLDDGQWRLLWLEKAPRVRRRNREWQRERQKLRQRGG